MPIFNTIVGGVIKMPDWLGQMRVILALHLGMPLYTAMKFTF